MSVRIFYDIDGRISGPVSFIQLQLLATSGMLQPHHKVRKENDPNWFPAKQVKGLFDTTPPSAAPPAPAVPPSRNVGASTPPSPAPVFSAGAWNEPPAESPPEESEIDSTFDFFSDSGSPPPAPDPKSPFDPTGTLGAPRGTRAADDDALPMVTADDVIEEPAPAPPRLSKLPEPKTTVMRAEELNAGTRSDDTTRETAATATPESSAIEVIGQAAELLGSDAIRLLDGKMVFRLIRGWIQAMSKFSDGTLRATYLRLGSLDAAALEIRPTARRARGGPYPVLYFVAGNVQIAMTFQGSDKAHRAFLEKVLLAAAGKSPSAK